MFNDDGFNKNIILLCIVIVLFALWGIFSRYQTTQNEKFLLSRLTPLTKGELIGELDNVRIKETLPSYFLISDRKSMAAYIVKQYLSREDSMALRCTTDQSSRLHIVGMAADKSGFVYIDYSNVDPIVGGDINIIGVYRDFFGLKHKVVEKIAIDFNPPPREPSIQESIQRIEEEKSKYMESSGPFTDSAMQDALRRREEERNQGMKSTEPNKYPDSLPK